MQPHIPFVPAWQTRSTPAYTNWWETYSPKAGRVVRLFGNLTYYLWIWIESCPTWETLCEHPKPKSDASHPASALNASLWAKDRTGQEVFFWTKYTDQQKVREDPAEVHGDSFALAEAQYPTIGRAVALDRLLLAQPHFISNWTLILRFVSSSRRSAPTDLEMRIVRCVRTRGSLTIKQIEAEFAPLSESDIRTAVFCALYSGQLRADLNNITLNTATLLYHAS